MSSKSTTKTGEIVAYSEAAIRGNISAVEYCRTSMAALSGCAAGMHAFFSACNVYRRNFLNIKLQVF